ncbi:Protein transport protein Sec61 subunit gamma [Vitis vinifera]|uniref:Protein transport protein Sec61 subunit gamma n=1 Tax=Vitis vinifera TaxID=29760 RepID=A0A438EXT3_VITVI|nr:Protein transport protein Sec61 subunit gamma [Vitis vinifera]
MDAIDSAVDPLREFSKDSVRLVKRCHKPDRKEYTKVAFRTATGFVVMGFVGFFREVDLHSDQQHHRWVWLGNASYLIYAFGCVWLDSIVALELDNPIPIPIPIPKLGCFFDIMPCGDLSRVQENRGYPVEQCFVTNNV